MILIRFLFYAFLMIGMCEESRCCIEEMKDEESQPLRSQADLENQLDAIEHYGHRITSQKTIEESVQEDSLIEFGYSNPEYDNVGLLGVFSKWNESTEDFLGNSASAVYVGGGFCLSAAHCFSDSQVIYGVCFEVGGKKTKLYKVKHFTKHPYFESGNFFDIAILFLEEKVSELKGLAIDYDFSKETRNFKNTGTHLVYVGYGVRLLCGGMLRLDDQKRKGLQAYTDSCAVKKDQKDGRNSRFYIQSKPFDFKVLSDGSLSHLMYGSVGRYGMSGGAVLDPHKGLVAIYNGKTGNLNKNESLDNETIRQKFLRSIFSCINSFGIFPINADYFLNWNVMHSIPLGPLREWIEETMKKDQGGDVEIV